MFLVFRQASRSTIPLRSSSRLYIGPRATSFIPNRRTIITKRYTEDHEVISFDDATSQGTLSITEYASKSLGDVVFVELPKEGTQVAKGEQIGAVESVKAASDIYAPVSGTIEEINKALGDRPGLMSSSPETDGWLCKLRLSQPNELDTLLTGEAYEKYCKGLSD